MFSRLHKGGIPEIVGLAAVNRRQKKLAVETRDAIQEVQTAADGRTIEILSERKHVPARLFKRACRSVGGGGSVWKRARERKERIADGLEKTLSITRVGCSHRLLVECIASVRENSPEQLIIIVVCA